MQINIINDLEAKLRQKLPIGKRQQIISSINQFRETVRNAEATMLQTITRRLQVPQNEFFQATGLEKKLAEYLKRNLTSEEVILLRQSTAIMNNSIIQAQNNFINKLFYLTRLSQSEIEGVLRKHKLFMDISNG